MTKIVKTISTEEAMQILKDSELGTITKATLVNWIRKYRLGRKVGGRWRIDEDKFLKHLDIYDCYRGKYYKRILEEGANVVMLEPDVAKVFVDSATVNYVLRTLLNLTKTTRRLTKHSSGRTIARR